MATSEQRKHGGYANAIDVLLRHGVRFVVCGGVASLFYGVPRSTLDLDILVDLSDENLDRLISAAQELRLQPRIPESITSLKDPRRRREWVEHKNAKVFTLVASDSPLQVDIFLEYPVPFEQAYAAGRIAHINESQFRVSSIEHLIQAKCAVQPHRDVDEFDVKHLRRILEHGR